MKAQFVAENIRFEREGDPLDKLGIGSFQQRTLKKIKSLVRSQWPDAEFLDEEIQVNLEYFDTFFMKISLKVSIDDINADNSPDRPTSLSIFGEDLDEEMDKLGLEVWDLSQEKKKFWKRNKKDIICIEVLNKDAALIYYDSPEALDTPQKRPEGLMGESIRFERGKDPKDALGIGEKWLRLIMP